MRRALSLPALVTIGACAVVFAFEPSGGGTRPAGMTATQSLPGGEAMDAEQQERIDIGLAISPVPVDLQGRNPRQVGLGSYLVNAAGACNDCHTWPTYVPGGDPYMGQPAQVNTANYLAGGRPFPPAPAPAIFYSRNLTPDPVNGLPGGRTYAEFTRAMREGYDFDCVPGGPVPACPIMQVMPWPFHADLNENDMQAIYAYLGAIPHADPVTAGDQP